MSDVLTVVGGLAAGFVGTVAIGAAIGWIFRAECQAHDPSREHWCDLYPLHRGAHVCDCGHGWEAA